MKYKVGDIVKVKQGLIGGRFIRSLDDKDKSLYFAIQMEKYCGQTATIKEVFPSREVTPEVYSLSIGEWWKWKWSAEMLEPLNKGTIEYWLLIEESCSYDSNKN